MTKEQAIVLAVYTGIHSFAEGYESDLTGYEKALIKQGISSHDDFYERYNSYNKSDLALIEYYTGVDLLLNEDKYLLKKYNGKSEQYLKEKMLSMKVDDGSPRDNKAESIAENIFVAIIVLSAVAVIAVDGIFFIGYMLGKIDSVDIPIAITLLGGVAMFIEMLLMHLVTKKLSKNK